MADFSKMSAVELKELLAKEGVEIPEDAKKKDLVALAEKNVEGEKKEEVKADKKDLGEDEEVDFENVTMEDRGYSPTGRFEVIKLSDSAEVYRVFGPRGQKITPVFDKEEVVGKETLQPVGLASRVASGHNMHLQRTLGNKAYEKILNAAMAQGLAR